jgi:hypothetical protein
MCGEWRHTRAEISQRDKQLGKGGARAKERDERAMVQRKKASYLPALYSLSDC